MSKRQVFFSFRFTYDAWRAGMIRNMGKVSDDSTFSDNDWEEVKKKSDIEIKRWIDREMNMRSCVVVLVGEHSYNRKWIDYEIKRAWETGKGIVAIRIHGLKNKDCVQAKLGHDPLSDFVINTTINHIEKHSNLLDDEKRLSDVCMTYDPPYQESEDIYHYIENNIADWIEEAIRIRSRYPK